MTDEVRNYDVSDAADRTQPACVRGEQLVAYIYAEANEDETRSFEEHLSQCVLCREELAAFGMVREAVGAWRTAALNINTSPTPAGEAVPAAAAAAFNSAPARPPHERSALAALRAFFILSPNWLRAGVVTASVMVCALAMLGFARTEVSWGQHGIALRTGGRAAVASPVPARNNQTERQVEQLQALHALEINELRERLREKEESLLAARAEARDSAARAKAAAAATPPTMTASFVAPRKRRSTSGSNAVPAAQTTGEQMGAADDYYSPRLYDLLGDVD